VDELNHFGQEVYTDADPFIKISPVNLKFFPGVFIEDEGYSDPVILVHVRDKNGPSTALVDVSFPGNEVHSFEVVHNLEEKAVMMELVIKELGLQLRGQPGHTLVTSTRQNYY
jgi:hypothetical protein